MTQFKEKAGKDKEKASVGLYIYPILMAADILLYDATHVPVGEDQKQHLELTRDIAQKFNTDVKVQDFFKIPDPLIQEKFSRIMSLKDAKNKMSKSDPSDASRINLTDTEEQIIIKLKSKTDTKSFPANEKDLNKRPEIQNLIGIYSSLKSQKIRHNKWISGKNFSNFKEKLSEVVIENISPISKEISKLKSDKGHILQVLKDGSEKAEAIASEKVKKIKEIIGF